jgi:hypothetical protein
MEFNRFAEKLKEEFPDKAIDISEGLELLRQTINDSIETIGDKISTAVKNRDFEKINVYSDMVKEADIFEKKIYEVMNLLEVEEVDIEEETEEEIEKKTIPNYDEYVVDHNIEHNLYENFTHKRPFAFKLNDYKVIEVKTWQDLLIKTCEYLIAIDEKKFLSFENNDAMNGKKNKYFSTNPNDIRKARKVGEKIFVEINQSGNAIRNLIIKLLKEYDFKISEYKIYFRADYSNLNSK